jgi:3-oxoadipate enol-lactonase
LTGRIDCGGAIVSFHQSGVGPDLVWLSGGGGLGSQWDEFQVPYFEKWFRSTTYDARGVGETACLTPPPWSMEDYGADCIALIERACEPPVTFVGLSMGSLIAQQVALDRPDLVRSAVLLGTMARSTGFLYDWMAAEIDFRASGGRLGSDFGLAHYAPFCYPAEVLGDDALWGKLRERLRQKVDDQYAPADEDRLTEWGLVPQWQACLEFDSLERLPACEVPLHVIAFSEDTQTPPSRGRLVAEAARNGHFHLFEGMGHVSIFGHGHEVLNPFIRGLIERYV